MYRVYLFGKMKEACGASVSIQSAEAKLSKATFLELLYAQYPPLLSHSFSIVANEKKIGSGDSIFPTDEIVLIPNV